MKILLPLLLLGVLPGAIVTAGEKLLVAPGASLPVRALPSQVKAPDGKLTLFADYSDVRGEHVVLYVVNRTKKGLRFFSQDGDLMVKLEARSKEDKWQRAQEHRFSWCGNSYMVMPELKPGHFFRFLGYYPSKGEERLVRYRTYESGPGEELVSNAGKGCVSPKLIEECRGDSMAAYRGDFETVAAIAQRRIRIVKRDHIDVLRHAVRNLGRFPHPRCVAVLQGLLLDEDAEIRKLALLVLGGFGKSARSALPLMRRLANEDPDHDVQATAEKQIARILGAKETAPPKVPGPK